MITKTYTDSENEDRDVVMGDCPRESSERTIVEMFFSLFSFKERTRNVSKSATELFLPMPEWRLLNAKEGKRCYFQGDERATTAPRSHHLDKGAVL